ncbi:MAG TPA: alpha/beta hydrolase [Lachnospiraceae bacterium]|nr:alpha/beta hydrolase [Lachnospiraceae bacterium]
MKITYEMIDRQLRMTGKLTSCIFKISREDDIQKQYTRMQKVIEMTQSGRRCIGVKCKEEFIRRSKDRSRIRVRVYQSQQPKGNVPGILWLHGGGYALGVPEVCNRRYKAFTRQSDCVVIAPHYRLSITDPYPAALEDAYDTLLWMKKHANELGIRSDQLMVGGESAGGGLAAALCLLARDRGDVNIAFQMPLYPMLDDRMVTESATENNAPIWNSVTNEKAWRLYLGELYGNKVTQYAAAARATNFSNLPPMVTFIGELEVFRDETIQYAKNLRKAGVPVRIKVFKGCYHAFDITNPWADASKEADRFVMQAFRYAMKNFFAMQPEEK